MIGKRVLVSGVILALLFFCGFNSAIAQHDPKKDGGTLTLALKEKLDTLDVFKSSLAEPLRVLGMTCETLVVFDNELNVKPLLAKSWSVSEDKLTWSFQLEEGINFHDGTPFNAQSFKTYFWDWFIPKSYSGDTFKTVKKIEVTGEYSVDFILEKPFPMLLTNLADPWNIIQSPVALKKHGDRYGFDALVGTGPYMFKSWVRGDRIELVKNPDYRHGPDFLSNQGPGYVDQIIFRIVPEPITRVAELRHGKVDLIRTVPENMLPELDKDDNVQTMLAPSLRVVYIFCNTEKPIMQDKRIREAINHAIDRKAVLDATFHGFGEAAYGLLPPGSTGFWPGSKEYGSKVLTFDPNKSKALLDQAGWVLPTGKSIREKDGQKLSLNIVAVNVPRYKLPAEVVTAMLADVGIEINLEIFDAAAASARLEAGEFDFAVTGWAYNVGEVTLDLVSGSGSIPNPNYGRYKSSVIDEALETVRSGSTADERNAAAAKIQREIIDDQIVIPLVIRSDSIGAKKKVGGLDQLNRHPWWLDLAVALELFVAK
jgi:peptide/nickel transport system substrate-binding protein